MSRETITTFGLPLANGLLRGRGNKRQNDGRRTRKGRHVMIGSQNISGLNEKSVFGTT